MSLKKGAEIELEVTSTAFKGKGIAKKDGLVVFIPGTAPGDRILARITKKKKSYREAKLIEILDPSPERIEPRCRHADTCGGCTWQHLPYLKQLEYKQQHVREHMERIAGLDPDIVKDIAGCENEFYYRNKMEYSFGTRRWLSRREIEKDTYVDDSGFAAGLHAPGRFDKILDLKECHLQNPVSYRILDSVREYCLKNQIPAYDTKSHNGFMRNLVIRTSHHSNELMVNFVTNGDKPGLMEKLTSHLTETFPEISTVVNNIQEERSPTAEGQYEHILFGNGTITDSIGRFTFEIGANAFFQTNTKQAELLYRTARDLAALSPDELLYDLYCGVGTLTLFMSDEVGKAVGIELSDVALKNARENTSRNQVENTAFYKGDMKDTFNEELLSETGRPDCILTDPPRAGMHPDVVRQLVQLCVPKLIYISCNPSTMARDLKTLSEVYRVHSVQPVDMFPQTYHIEAVAKLTPK